MDSKSTKECVTSTVVVEHAESPARCQKSRDFSVVELSFRVEDEDSVTRLDFVPRERRDDADSRLAELVPRNGDELARSLPRRILELKRRERASYRKHREGQHQGYRNRSWIRSPGNPPAFHLSGRPQR
jgi:hypothetical protein